jgi:hypothetical protein
MVEVLFEKDKATLKFPKGWLKFINPGGILWH